MTCVRGKNLFDWLLNKNKEKLKQEKERQLRESLASKVAKHTETTANANEQTNVTVTDFTIIDINGKKQRVAKQQIDISDV